MLPLRQPCRSPSLGGMIGNYTAVVCRRVSVRLMVFGGGLRGLGGGNWAVWTSEPPPLLPRLLLLRTTIDGRFETDRDVGREWRLGRILKENQNETESAPPVRTELVSTTCPLIFPASEALVVLFDGIQRTPPPIHERDGLIARGKRVELWSLVLAWRLRRASVKLINWVGREQLEKGIKS